MDMKLMGQRVRAARNLRHMTTESLAEQLGIAPASLGHIECGARKPSLQTLMRIADILDVSLDYLSGRSPSVASSLIQSVVDEEALSERQKAMLLDAAKQLIPVVKQYS